MQTADEGAGRPIEPGPFAPRQHSASIDSRPDDAAPPNSLLAHHSRLRVAGHCSRHDSSAELSERDAQGC